MAIKDREGVTKLTCRGVYTNFGVLVELPVVLRFVKKFHTLKLN